MIGIALIVLVVLWIFSYGPFGGFDLTLFNFNGKIITLWDLLIFAVILWAIGILPSPLRQIIGIILILWILSTLGIFTSLIAFTGLSQLLLAVIIIAVLISLF